MSRLILYMAMSLDGFITGPNDDKGNPAGDGGMRLQEWLGHGGPEVADYRPTDRQSQIVFDEIMSTGAVITGRRTGAFADYWGGDHHDGVPIFVPTHTTRRAEDDGCQGSAPAARPSWRRRASTATTRWSSGMR